MDDIEHRFSALTQAQKYDWKAPAGQPNLSPADEALHLQELHTELNRDPEVGRRPDDFRNGMQSAERNARALEASLRAARPGEANLLLGRLTAGCASCHARYRDNPQAH